MSEPFEGVDLTFEVGFGFGPLASAPTWTDISDFTFGFGFNRGRSRLLDTFQTETGHFLLDNRDGRFDPNNASSPYSPNVKLAAPVRVQAVHNLITYTLFRGTVERWPVTYGEAGLSSELQVLLLGLMAQLASFDMGEFAASAQTTDERVEAVLDEVGWPAGLRDLDVGVADVAAEILGGSALQAINEAVIAEAAVFFVAADGTATFRNRVADSGGGTSIATFGPSGADLEYEAVQVSYDDDHLFNHVTADGDGVDPQVASDAASIADFGRRSTKLTAPFVNEPHALNVAEWQVGRLKDVKPTIRGLTLAPQTQDAIWEHVLGRELRDVVTVKVDPPGGGTDLSQEVTIEAVAHRATATTWRTQWQLLPLSDVEINGYWILGTSELDTDTRLA